MIFFRCVHFILCIWALALMYMNWSPRQLWVTKWVLGMEPGSSARAAIALSLSLSITEPSLQSQGARPLNHWAIPLLWQMCKHLPWAVCPLNNILHLPGRVSFRGCWQCCSALSVEQEAALGVYWLQCCFSQGTSEPPCLDGQLWKVLFSPVHVQLTKLINSFPCACFYFLWFSSLFKFPHWVAL